MTDTAVEDARGRARTGAVRRFVYLVNGLWLAIPAFVLAVAGFSLGVSTFAVWLGLPVLAATFAACGGLAAAERRATERATGAPLPPHWYRPLKDGRAARWFGRLRDPQSWRDLLHAVVAFPVRIATFVIAVTWVVAGFGGLLSAAWLWSIPGYSGLYFLLTGNDWLLGEIIVETVLGAVVLALAPAVLVVLTALRAGLARGLLTNEPAALRARAAQLESSRRAAVQAEAQTLRRVERDIHDGPQQRLVRLNMDLEAAVRRLDAAEPDRARALVHEALEHSRDALDELRALSRGIAPPVLADRGLAAALAAAAARCPVEVVLQADLPSGRLAEAVETTAYFVVTEALTNVAKHAQATQATVRVGVDGERMLVQVADDGRGGAHLGKGHGLAGLADRLATVEGALDVHSPAGGPTVLTAEIPLRSI